MNISSHRISTREAAIGGLAFVGFVALIGASIWLAISASRFVPEVVNRLGGAAVYIGSIFTPVKDSFLSVVSDPTVIPFEEASSTPLTADSGANSLREGSSTITRTIPTPTTSKKITSPIRIRTTSTNEISGATTTASASNLFGLPDFIVKINAIGYLATTSAESFVASSTVPAGSRPAVKFTIKNIGTNVSDSWRFNASIPTQNAYVYQSYLQQPLAPGDSIDYTLGFDQAKHGPDQIISITANFDHVISESNMNNNSTSTKITVLDQ